MVSVLTKPVAVAEQLFVLTFVPYTASTSFTANEIDLAVIVYVPFVKDML